MAQSSCEVVRRAIQFQNPDRLPVVMPSLGISDVAGVSWNQIGVGDLRLRQTLDEWCCTWERTEIKNMGQVTGHPLADWSSLEHFHFPDPDNPDFYNGMEKRFSGTEDKFICTNLFMLLFERLHSLRGFSNTLMDLGSGDQRFEALADRIVDYDLAIIQNISSRFPGQIHAMNFTDDWGTEQRTIIHPRMWDSFFKPRYKRIFDAIHQAGWFVWMHSCGEVSGVVDGLIEIGVDVLNLQQPRVFGLEGFGQRFAGKVAFESLCDIQHTLPFKGKAEIEGEARLLIEYWSTPQGGFILGDYGDGEAIGVSLESKRWMYDAFQACDRWKITARNAS
jgi:uroporphyrinogen decarboxylase